MSFGLTLVRQGEYHPATVTAPFDSALYCLEEEGEIMPVLWYVNRFRRSALARSDRNLVSLATN